MKLTFYTELSNKEIKKWLESGESSHYERGYFLCMTEKKKLCEQEAKEQGVNTQCKGCRKITIEIK